MLDDGLTVKLDKKILNPGKGERVFIPQGVKHRVSSKKGGRILELSKGFFAEMDIIRLEDKYGRV